MRSEIVNPHAGIYDTTKTRGTEGPSYKLDIYHGGKH